MFKIKRDTLSDVPHVVSGLWSDYSSSSPLLPLPPPPPLPPPASPPVVVPWSSSVTVFSSVSSSVVHDSCAPRMAAAARLCRLLPTGRKNVVASLVVHFRLHFLEAQVFWIGVPLTIYRRIQLTQHSQVRSALPLSPLDLWSLATNGTQESVATERRFSSTARRGKSTKGRKNAGG